MVAGEKYEYPFLISRTKRRESLCGGVAGVGGFVNRHWKSEVVFVMVVG